MRLLAFLALALATPVAAQVAYPPGVNAGDVQQAIEGSMPGACPTPLPDTLAGTPGSQPVCMARPDASRPTVIQAQDTVTAADATWAITFSRAFAVPPIYVDARIYGQGQPFLCTVQTATTTGASGKCFQLVATTLPLTVTSLLGLVLSPVTSAAASLPVRVIARQ